MPGLNVLLHVAGGSFARECVPRSPALQEDSARISRFSGAPKRFLKKRLAFVLITINNFPPSINNIPTNLIIMHNLLEFVWNVEHRKPPGRRAFTMPALLGVLLCALGLLAIPGKAESVTKPYPAGIIWLTQADTPERPLGELSSAPRE